MAVGNGELGDLHPVPGFELGVASAGIKKPGRLDLVIMHAAEPASIAGVFTRNQFCAAPVQVAKRHLARGQARYLLVNTGNANAGTGEQGMRDCEQTCQQLARELSVDSSAILPFSTGVIGEPLPVEKIVAAMPAALADLQADNWMRAAEGIMTTDTRPKAASVQIPLPGGTVTLTGISKGAGMIKPNMATMLSYVATDAEISTALLQELLTEAVDRSFNRITVDGDTSTNDACMLVATGVSGVAVEHGEALLQFRQALQQVMEQLAQAIIRDAEGATKFVAVVVEGGQSEQECAQIAFTVAESPLVKTALFASDPNWGRILAAIGRAGIADLDVSKIALHINDVLIAENGGRSPAYSEEQGEAVMAGEELEIRISLHRGEQQATVWTSDLSHEYVRINAEYRT